MSANSSARPPMSLADRDKGGLSSAEPTARRIARRLIDSRQPERQAAETRARAGAAACEDLYRDLSRWVGLDGCHALFTRALAEARTESEALEEIKLRPRSEPYLDGIAESITSSGDAAIAEALETMLIHVVELLGRLIGDDIATKLIELSIAAPSRGDATSDNRREEA